MSRIKRAKLNAAIGIACLLGLVGITAIAIGISIFSQSPQSNGEQERVMVREVKIERREQLELLNLIANPTLQMLSISLGYTSIILLVYNLKINFYQYFVKSIQSYLKDEQHQYLNSIFFEDNPAFFVAIDTDGKVRAMNPSMLNALGYLQEEVIGIDYLSTFVLERDRPALFNIFYHHHHSLESISHQSSIVSKNGQEILVEWHGSSVLDPNTNKIDYFFGLGIDISDRHRRETEIHLLYQLTQTVSESQNFEEALAATMELICETTGWDIAEAWIPSLQEKELVCSPVWYSQVQKHQQIWQRIKRFREVSEKITFPPNVGLPGRVWSSRKSEWIVDVSQGSSELFLRNKIAAESGIKAGFGVPILANSHVLAVLVFFMQRSQEKDSEFMELVSSVAMQLGSVFESKQAEAKYRNIFENSIEGIFQTTPNGKMIGANPALAKIYGYSCPEELLDNMADVEHQLYVNPESRQAFRSLLQDRDILSDFEAEIYRRDGSKIWISERARVVRDCQGSLLYYEGSVVDITERKKQEQQLQYYASHDSLTGLINRAYFLKTLTSANTRSHHNSDYRFAILFIDLDGFKSINDSMGHWVGDLLLIAIAWTLKQCIRAEDTLARLGGDEFTILVENVENFQDIFNIARRIHDDLKQPFKLGGHDVFIQASIGIAYNLAESYEVDDVLRNADIAMYRAKKQGKNCTVVFDWAMRQEVMERMQIETDLRLLLYPQHDNDRDPGEFYVYYQPIVDLKTGKISGLEALIRWSHPDWGFVSPSMFIPVAEESGLIREIGDWVLLESCRQLKQWQDDYSYLSHLKMSVNLSSRQLTPQLCDRVDQILAETGVLGKFLKLEITETAIMDDPESAIAIFQELKKRHIQLSIDDFGTGYCSLGYLHRFPVDTLKIDRSFTQQISQEGEKNEIIYTIIALANSLGLETIAEGIETTAQIQQLQQLNCSLGQGFFFSKPLETKNITTLLNQHQGYLPMPNLPEL